MSGLRPAPMQTAHLPDTAHLRKLHKTGRKFSWWAIQRVLKSVACLFLVLVLKLRLIIIVFDLNSNCSSVFNFSLHLYSYVLSFPLSQLFQLLILFCRYLGDLVHLKTMKQTEAPEGNSLRTREVLVTQLNWQQINRNSREEERKQ